VVENPVQAAEIHRSPPEEAKRGREREQQRQRCRGALRCKPRRRSRRSHCVGRQPRHNSPRSAVVGAGDPSTRAPAGWLRGHNGPPPL
jgi:hypothetical protein